MSNEIAAAREAESGSHTWSLCWQAAAGRDFLVHRSLPEDIRGRLIAAHRRRGRVLVDFVILHTEIHVVSRLRPGDSIESVARSIANVVSRWVREIQPSSDHVMAGKYRAQRFDSDADVREEIRMLAWLPVARAACAMKHHYPHAALRYAMGLRPGGDFDALPLLLYFGENVASARPEMSRQLEKPPSGEEWRAWELNRGLHLATGSVGPRPFMARKVAGPAARIIAASGGYGIDGALELLEIWVGARIQPAAPIDLHQADDMVAARGRALVGCLAVSIQLCSASSVARHFHLAKSTLCERMARCKELPADRLILRTAPQRIVEEATALRDVAQARSQPPDEI
ncbi:hypothetical protein [Pelomonas sp. KK5]|uniref:hypothetical protein n=1 Tax=Pelomonas sp. KK5 TaxID=1855730 RepID=UPI00097C5F39|nr:hypothetical protein [Pelomonas sp. KK5]